MDNPKPEDSTPGDLPDIKKYYENSYSIIIGINQYKEEVPLSNARNDATAVMKVLEDHYGFITLKSLFNEEARADQIRELFDDTLQDRDKIGPKDRVIIYYSGHGKLRIMPGHEGEEIKEGYIVPYDSRKVKYSSNISMKTIIDACRTCQAKHVLLILDCCYSGFAATRGSVKKIQQITGNYIRDISSRRAIQIFAAGQEDEPVSDSGIRPGYSAFTGALLDILEGNDPDNNGILTASEIGHNLQAQVLEQRGTYQRPAYTHISGSGGGDFIFKIFDTEQTRKLDTRNTKNEARGNVFYKGRDLIKKTKNKFFLKRQIRALILVISVIAISAFIIYNNESRHVVPPIASIYSSASNNITDEGKIVTLYGTKSKDPNGGKLEYFWRELPIRAVNLNEDFGSTTSFTAPPIGYNKDYTFQLEVKNKDGKSDNATIVIQVKHPQPSLTSFPSTTDPDFGITFEYPSNWVKKVEKNIVQLRPPSDNEIPPIGSSFTVDAALPTYFAVVIDNESSNRSLGYYSSEFINNVTNSAKQSNMTFHLIKMTDAPLNNLSTNYVRKIFYNLTNSAGMTERHMVILSINNGKLYNMDYSAGGYYYNRYLTTVQNIVDSIDLTYMR
jgi:hypothetical protein